MPKYLEIAELGKITFRPMSFMDVPGVHLVECRAYDFPWSEGLFSDCVKVGYHCWVLELDDIIIGYAIFRVEVGEAHLFNIAVDPEYQNKGIGKAFLALILQRMKELGAYQVLLEVRESNKAAQKVYQDFKFKQIGVRRGYYPDKGKTREDAIILQLLLS